MMEFEKFVEHIMKQLGGICDTEEKVELKSIPKNNGVTKLGIVITRENVNVTPIVYFDSLYEAYKSGMSLKELLSDVEGVLKNSRCIDTGKLAQLLTVDNIKNKVVFRLVNMEKNRELLKTVPYIPFLDLAIVFYIALRCDDTGISTVQMTNEHAEQIGLNAEKIFEIALKNTMTTFTAEVTKLHTLCSEIEQAVGLGVSAEIPDDDNMYVVTNNRRYFGAGVMLYTGLLDDVLNKFQVEQCIIIPSSVHEVILLLADDTDADAMEEMIRQVNAEMLEKDEVLSDRAYSYSKNTGKITLLATTTES